MKGLSRRDSLLPLPQLPFRPLFKRDQIGRTGVRFPCVCSPWPTCVSDARWSVEGGRAETPELFRVGFPTCVLRQAWSMCLCCEAWDDGARREGKDCPKNAYSSVLVGICSWGVGGMGRNFTLCIHQ